jgi:hypothetical protein
MIAETFFLHDRGRVFSFYTIMILVVELDGLVIIVMLVFADETSWTRPGGLEFTKPASSKRRRIIGTYFFTTPLFHIEPLGKS